MASLRATRVVVIIAVAAGLLVGGAGSVAAQGPGIPELRRLLGERETDIIRLEAQLRTQEQRADSLSRAKRGARPGSARFEALSNEILESSQEITGLARRLRVLYQQVRSLQTDLYLAYSREIAQANQRIEELTGRPRTDQTAAELRRLVSRLETYVPARDDMALALESGQEDLLLLDLTFDARDDPSRLRVKQAIAQDLIERIDRRIAGIQNQIDRQEQKKRTLEEFRRLREDIELWGDREGSGRQLDAILEGRSAGTGEMAEAFADPDARILELQRQRLDLIDRRSEYENMERLFAQRLKEFYP